MNEQQIIELKNRVIEIVNSHDVSDKQAAHAKVLKLEREISTEHGISIATVALSIEPLFSNLWRKKTQVPA